MPRKSNLMRLSFSHNRRFKKPKKGTPIPGMPFYHPPNEDLVFTSPRRHDRLLTRFSYPHLHHCLAGILIDSPVAGFLPFLAFLSEEPVSDSRDGKGASLLGSDTDRDAISSTISDTVLLGNQISQQNGSRSEPWSWVFTIYPSYFEMGFNQMAVIYEKRSTEASGKSISFFWN